MAERDNEGILSKNDRKTEPNHADIKGKCTIDGKEYWINGWKKQRKKDGGTFYALSFRPINGGSGSGNRSSGSEEPF